MLLVINFQLLCLSSPSTVYHTTDGISAPKQVGCLFLLTQTQMIALLQSPCMCCMTDVRMPQFRIYKRDGRFDIVLEAIKHLFACSIYCALKIDLQCCTTQTSFRGEIFHDFHWILVKITENRGHFGEIMSPRVVVCVVSLQIKFESTIVSMLNCSTIGEWFCYRIHCTQCVRLCYSLWSVHDTDYTHITHITHITRTHTLMHSCTHMFCHSLLACDMRMVQFKYHSPRFIPASRV